MATIVTRTAKGSALTFAEVDGNFTNLNADGIANTSSISNLQNDKLDKSGGTMTGSLVLNSNLTTNAKVITNSAANSQSGSLVTLTTPGTEIVRLTNVLLTSLAGIQAGTAGQKLILSNRSGTTITVENESSSASTSADQISTGTGAAISIQNNASISLIYDGNLSKWNIIGGTGSGTGSAGINYIANPDASIGTTGYTPYNDGTAVPVDGSGGTPSSGLWVRSTTTPLRGSGDFNLVKTGSVSYLGQGVAYDFTIDNADLAKVLTVTFDYEVVSGTYATGDATVYIIQDPAGTPVVIQPAGYQIQAATVGTKMRQIATFQTASNVTSYRLCIHIASASTSDYTLALDTISVGPQVVQYGAPVTDWQSYTPVVTGITVGNGTLLGLWRRVGDSIEVKNHFIAGTTSASTGQWSFSLPSGLSFAGPIDTLGDVCAGTATWLDSGIARYLGGVRPTGTNAAGIVSLQAGATKYDDAGSGGPAFTNADTISLIYTARINGWSSTVQMSNDTDTRVVAAKYTGLVSAAISTTQPLQYNTKEIDTHNAVTTGTSWKFTAPVPGIYEVSILASSTASSSNAFVYKNGVQGSLIFTINSTNNDCGSAIVELNAGDFIDVRPNSALTANTLGQGHISIRRLSGPSAIAASETVAARYTGVPTGTTAGTFAAAGSVTYPTKTFDTHGMVSGSNINIPVAGKYKLYAKLQLNCATSSNDGFAGLAVYVDGVIYSTHLVKTAASFTTVYPTISESMNLNAGQVVTIRCATNVTTPVFSDALSATLAIERIGN